MNRWLRTCCVETSKKNYLQIQPWCGVLFLFLCSCHNTIFQKYLSPKLIFCFYLIWGCSCNQDRCLKTIIDYKPPFYKELIRGVLNNTEHMISIPTEFEAIFFNYFSSCFELFLCGFSQALQPSRIFELKVNRFIEFPSWLLFSKMSIFFLGRRKTKHKFVELDFVSRLFFFLFPFFFFLSLITLILN